jgi:hypothetical protein
MPWVATDHRQRTVEEILARGAGNCADHARVLQSLLEERGIRTRWVQEINIQPPSRSRQSSAERMVAEQGPRASVFGRRHNDHRWLEVWDDDAKAWFPADSSIGISGWDSWVCARLGFGARPAPVAEMLFPVVIVAGDPAEDRGQAYLVEAFDRAYGGRLSRLPIWPSWVAELEFMAPLGLGAFRGKVNLHQHDPKMTRLQEIYAQLGAEALATGLHLRQAERLDCSR